MLCRTRHSHSLHRRRYDPPTSLHPLPPSLTHRLSSSLDYIYLNELHPAVGFAFVWACFVVIKTGAAAITSLIFARYFGSVILSDLDVQGNIDADYRIKMLAIAALTAAVGLNIVGTKWVSKVQRVFFVCKLFAITCVCVMGTYSVVLGDTQDIAWENLEDVWYVAPGEEMSPWSVFLYMGSFGSAVIASLWAYEGFNTLNFVAGEIKNPQRNIPISIIIAVAIVVICYVSANVAYFAMLPKEVVISSRAVAISAANEVWGEWATYPMAFLVAFSALGSVNANVMTSPRVFYAGAKNKVIPGSKWLSQVSEDFDTPYVAIILLGVMGALLLLPGSFEVLVNYFGFAAWIFYGLCGLSVIWIRLRRPQYNASFKVRPFPLIPVVFILCAVAIVCSSFVTEPVGTLGVSVLLLSGLPIYYLFYWRGNLFKKYYQSQCTTPEVL